MWTRTYAVYSKVWLWQTNKYINTAPVCWRKEPRHQQLFQNTRRCILSHTHTHTHTHTHASEFRLLTSFPMSWCVIRYIIFNMKNSTLAISDSMLMIRSKAVVYYSLSWSYVCLLRLCSNLSALCCSFFFVRGTMRHKENKRNWKKDRDVNDSKRKSV